LSDPRLTKEEIWQFLLDIESGTVLLTPVDDPQEIYAGDVSYAARNCRD
jgi:hypothetical protein